jgi:hypothetical protein
MGPRILFVSRWRAAHWAKRRRRTDWRSDVKASRTVERLGSAVVDEGEEEEETVNCTVEGDERCSVSNILPSQRQEEGFLSREAVFTSRSISLALLSSSCEAWSFPLTFLVSRGPWRRAIFLQDQYLHK